MIGLTHRSGDFGRIQSERDLQHHLDLRAVVEKDVACRTDQHIGVDHRRDHIVGRSKRRSRRSGRRLSGRLPGCHVLGTGKFNRITVCEDDFRKMNLKLGMG